MNRLTIIGNLTADPVLKTTASGTNVCNFNVAVKRRKGGTDRVDFFRVTAWQQLGENCAKYLEKGKKVAVTGPVSGQGYMGKDDGQPHAQLDIVAEDVEFLSSKGEV